MAPSSCPGSFTLRSLTKRARRHATQQLQHCQRRQHPQEKPPPPQQQHAAPMLFFFQTQTHAPPIVPANLFIEDASPHTVTRTRTLTHYVTMQPARHGRAAGKQMKPRAHYHNRVWTVWTARLKQEEAAAGGSSMGLCIPGPV